MLKSLAVRMEERVAILLPDTPEWVVAFFGSMKIGAVAVPLNTMLKPADYEYLHQRLPRAGRGGPSVAAGRHRPGPPTTKGCRWWSTCWSRATTPAGTARWDDALSRASPKLAAADTSKDDMAFWLYSSGTTGFPKGAIHLHHDMLVEAELYARQTIGLREDDVSFSVAKLFFAYGLGNGLYFPLCTGGTTVLLPDRPTPETVFATIERYQPTVFYGVPTSYAAMLHLAEKTGRTSLGRVRMCVSAGEALPAAPVRKMARPVRRRDPRRHRLDRDPAHLHLEPAGPGAAGKHRPDRARLRSPDPRRPRTTSCRRGRSAPCSSRATASPPATGTSTSKPRDTFRGQWINTHDKFLVDEDGYFWYAGRTDDMIKVSGQAVWPADVEGLIQRHPAVLESGVVGVADPDGLLKPVAYVVLKDGREPSDELARENPAVRQERDRPAQVSPRGRLRRNAAENGDRQDPTLPAPPNRRRTSPAAPRVRGRLRTAPGRSIAKDVVITADIAQGGRPFVEFAAPFAAVSFDQFQIVVLRHGVGHQNVVRIGPVHDCGVSPLYSLGSPSGTGPDRKCRRIRGSD